MSTTLTNGVIIPDNGSRNWGGDLANNWNILDVHVGYMTDVKNKVTTLETSVAENTANIQSNASNISALQTSKQDVIEDLETIRTGASAGATAVQPSALNNYATKTELNTKANASDLSKYLPLTGGPITGNLLVNSNSDGWKPGIEWDYNDKRYAYIHAFTDEAKGEKSLFIQAETHINLVSNDLTFNGKRLANAYYTTITTVTMHLGSVLTNGGKVVSFVVPINVDGSPTISFTRLRLRSNGYYLFGSTGNSDVTTSYTFTTTVFNGGINVVINFSDTDANDINNSCIVSEIQLKLTY